MNGINQNRNTHFSTWHMKYIYYVMHIPFDIFCSRDETFSERTVYLSK